MKAENKPYYSTDRVVLKKAVPLDTPFTLIIAPTHVCNLTCKYCIQAIWKEKKQIEKRPFIQLSLVEKVVEEAKGFPHRIKDVSLTSLGEPLLHKNLPDIVKILKNADITDRVQFFTNGTLLTRELSSKLIDAGLDEIRFSLQGLNNKKYKDVTNADVDFNNIVKNIRFFYENKGDCKMYIKIADIALDNEDKMFYDIFGDICDRIYIEKIIPLFKGVSYSFLNEANAENKYAEHHLNYNVCPNCFYTLTVLPNGNVLPCCNLYDPPIGDAYKENIVDIWNGEKRKSVLLHQLRNETDVNCIDCYVPNNQQSSDYLDDAIPDILERMEATCQ